VSRLSEIEVFVEVVDAGSLSDAARRLGVSKSHVSKHLAGLEERLGVRLIQRNTRRLMVTEAGRSLLERSRRILADIEEAELSVSEHQQAPHGTLRMTAPTTFGRLHVCPVVATYLQRWPDTAVELDLSDRRVDLMEESLDLAVRIGFLADSSFVARRLGTAKVSLWASPSWMERHGPFSHPQELPLDQGLLYAYQPPGAGWKLQGPGGAECQLPMRGRFTTNMGEATTMAAVAGVGVACLPDFFAEGAVASGELRRLLPDWGFAIPIWALYPNNRHLSPKVKVFVNMLAERLKDSDQRVPTNGG
jgi:DNA-binding transcriptional LysR family regulator